jgi:DeoR/GlpR family transcriptional regulator of sugar metabolism
MKDLITRIEYEVTWEYIKKDDAYSHSNRYTSARQVVDEIGKVLMVIDHAKTDKSLYVRPQDLSDFHIVKRIISEGEITPEEKEFLNENT